VDFSYKNVNVGNIKKAFEHFSNVVVSDFDPLGDEEKLIALLKSLSNNTVFNTHFKSFKTYHTSNRDIQLIMGIEDALDAFIKAYKTDAKKIKDEVLLYFKILNLIEFVIELDPKFSESLFIEFWRKYNMLYNQINKQTEVIDDVEIYFDNRIGIVSPEDGSEYVNKPKKPTATVGNGGKYKYNILEVIEKRNQEEEAIEELIEEFEKKITSFFEYIKTDENGQRLIAKIKDEGSAFSQDEIYSDFTKLYRKYTIKNKDLGEFFVRETKDILNQLCDDFERSLIKKYEIKDEDSYSMAADDE
jgi:type I restriction enzyme R subunit